MRCGGSGSGLLSSPLDAGTHRRYLLPQVHRSGRNDDSWLPSSARWQIRAGNGGAGDRQRTSAAWSGPAQMALAAQWMLQSRQSLPAQHSIPGRSCCLGKKPLWDSGQGGALLSRPQAPASQPKQVPAQSVWAGRQDPRGPHLWGHKAQESPGPAVPSLPQFSPEATAEIGSPRNSAVRAGVSTSEQSPRPDVSTGTCTRTPPSAPAGPCAPRPAATGP